MFIPLHDANALVRIQKQYITLGLIALNVLVWLSGLVGGTGFEHAAFVRLGYIPAVMYGEAQLPPDLVLVPSGWTLLTYGFLHGDFWHLAGNMLFLWVFGDNVEDAMGHVRFLLFYLACVAAGALVHGLAKSGSQAPLIGASAGVAGVIAAYLVLHPRVWLWVLAFNKLPLRVPAWLALGLWVGMQFLMLLGGGGGQVSWAAHVGGILAGAALVFVLRRRDQPLLDRGLVTPRAVRRSAPRRPG